MVFVHQLTPRDSGFLLFGRLVRGNHLIEDDFRLLVAVVRGERSQSLSLAVVLVEPTRGFLQAKGTEEEDETRNGRAQEDDLPGHRPALELLGLDPRLDHREINLVEVGDLVAVLVQLRLRLALLVHHIDRNLLVRIGPDKLLVLIDLLLVDNHVVLKRLRLDHLVGVTDQTRHDETDDGRKGKTNRQEQLEHARALATAVRVKTLGEVHRDDHADETRRGALKRTADRQENEAAAVRQTRETDHRDGDEKAEGGCNDDFLTAEELGERTREQRRENRTPEHRAHHEAQLHRRVVGRVADIRQGRGNNADINAVDESAQSRHNQQVLRITPDAGRHGVRVAHCFATLLLMKCLVIISVFPQYSNWLPPIVSRRIESPGTLVGSVGCTDSRNSIKNSTLGSSIPRSRTRASRPCAKGLSTAGS